MGTDDGETAVITGGVNARGPHVTVRRDATYTTGHELPVEGGAGQL